jgi:chromosome segregation ATPase
MRRLRRRRRRPGRPRPRHVKDVARAQEEAAKAREDLAPLLARVKELEEDIALVGGQRDALNIQVGMASAHVRTLEDEVVMLKGMV